MDHQKPFAHANTNPKFIWGDMKLLGSNTYDAKAANNVSFGSGLRSSTNFFDTSQLKMLCQGCKQF
jgi:hypothetical protein